MLPKIICHTIPSKRLRVEVAAEQHFTKIETWASYNSRNLEGCVVLAFDPTQGKDELLSTFASNWCWFSTAIARSYTHGKSCGATVIATQAPTETASPFMRTHLPSYQIGWQGNMQSPSSGRKSRAKQGSARAEIRAPITTHNRIRNQSHLLNMGCCVLKASPERSSAGEKGGPSVVRQLE